MQHFDAIGERKESIADKQALRKARGDERFQSAETALCFVFQNRPGTRNGELSDGLDAIRLALSGADQAILAFRGRVDDRDRIRLQGLGRENSEGGELAGGA